MRNDHELRNPGIDLIKILACMGVLSLHVYLHRLNEEPVFELQNILFYLGTLSMPIFFMVNGYLVMRRPHETKYYVKKIFNIFKIVFTVNLLWGMLLYIKGGTSVDMLSPIKETVKNLFFQSGYFSVFWFFGALSIIYLMMPLIDKYILKDRKRIYIFISFLVLVQFIVSIINLYCGYTGHTLLEQKIYQPFRLHNHLCYFLLGGVLNYTNYLQEKKCNKFYVIIAVIFASIFSAIVCNTVFNNTFVEFLHSNILITVAVLLLFVKLKSLKSPPPPHMQDYQYFKPCFDYSIYNSQHIDCDVYE